MYTAGYRYDWQHGLLKETGAINIDLEPKTATVLLNNIKLQEKIPVRLNNIIPARYTIHVSNPGYFDWNKEIEVKNKQTNYIKEISLLKKERPELLIAGDITGFATSFDGRFIIYATKENNAFGIWLWDNNTKQTKSLFRFSGTDTPAITWAKKNHYASVTGSTAPYTQITIINALDPIKQMDMTAASQNIQKIQWANSTEPQLYYSTQDTIFVYSPGTQKNQIITANTFADWYMENGQLWTLSLNSSTRDYILVRDTLGFNTIIEEIESDKINIESEGSSVASTTIAIATASQNSALLQTDMAGRMLLVSSNGTQPMQVDKFLISPYNNWWLMWSNWELWSYNESENPYLLNRSGEHLETTMPLDRYNTLALVWTDKTTVLFPYYSVSHELLNEKITNPTADTENKILYFIKNNKNEDKKSNGIWKLNY